jgi:hypothetical protein
VNLVQESVEVFLRIQGDIVAAAGVVEAFLGAGAEPFDFGFVFLLALFEEPEAFAHDLAGVAVGMMAILLFFTLAGLAIVANEKK